MDTFSRPMSVVTPRGERGYWPDEVEDVVQAIPTPKRSG
jgi:hypothetical protein